MLAKLRSRVRRWTSPRPACVIERVGLASIAYCPQHAIYLREYYLHCVGLFREALARSEAPLNLVFGDYRVDFGNAHRTRRIDIQHEHTLVAPGGRDSAGAPKGCVPLRGGSGHYLVRIANRDYVESLDAIIEYSQPNLANVRAAQGFARFLRKATYIAPLLYPPNFARRNGGDDIITLIHDTNQPRRRRFLADVRAAQLPLRNVRGVFDKAALQQQYDRTRILVNVHQTDHHHTFEELRVLPALLRGVIVVSEEVPLMEEVPYYRYIIWSRYDELAQTVRTVQTDYERYRARIFNDPALPTLLEQMRNDNMRNVQQAIGMLLCD